MKMHTRYQGEGYVPAANAVQVVLKLPNGMTREVCRFIATDDWPGAVAAARAVAKQEAAKFRSNTTVLVMDGQSNLELSSYKGSNGW